MTSTPALSAPGATASLPVTSADVVAGLGSLPIYIGPVDPEQPGAYLTPSPDFAGIVELRRRPSGFQATPGDDPVLFAMDAATLHALSPEAPVWGARGADELSAVLVGHQAGSVSLSVVE